MFETQVTHFSMLVCLYPFEMLWIGLATQALEERVDRGYYEPLEMKVWLTLQGKATDSITSAI